MNLDDATITAIHQKDKKLPITKMKRWRDDAISRYLDEDVPPKLDHRKNENPYLSRYGNDWEKHIDKTALVGRVCVTELIDHMFEQTKALFPGKDDWWVVHDALSQMMAESSLRYMREKDYFKHWVLPEHDLLDALPQCKYCKNKPVGNNPKAMPLDNQLN